MTAAERSWSVICAPIDSAGHDEGEVRAPQALLAAGAADAVRAGAPRLVGTGIHDHTRDAASGVIGVADARRSTQLIRDAVAEMLAAGRRPLVLGGDCTLVPGILAAAVAHEPDLRLVFLDGHLDACDGVTSPTGEAADMDLAVITGRGPAELEPDGAPRPLLAPDRITAIGFRADVEPDLPAGDGRLVTEAELVDPGVRVVDAAALARRRPEDVATEAQGGAPVWLHLDVDVLDQDVMPAVSYPQPDGPSIEAVARIVERLGDVRGAHVTCFNADLDPTGEHALAVVALIARLA